MDGIPSVGFILNVCLPPELILNNSLCMASYEIMLASQHCLNEYAVQLKFQIARTRRTVYNIDEKNSVQYTICKP